jgi:hypothetical protein
MAPRPTIRTTAAASIFPPPTSVALPHHFGAPPRTIFPPKVSHPRMAIDWRAFPPDGQVGVPGA